MPSAGSDFGDDVVEDFFPLEKTRHFLYQKVILSSDPSGADCIVLLKHGLQNHLSFARIGDTKWTWVDTMERCDRYDNFFYNENDNLFYAVRNIGEIHIIDLNSLSPVVKVILKPMPPVNCHTHYILRAPWGDLLQVRRLYGAGLPHSDDDIFMSYQEELVYMYLGQYQHELGVVDDEEACPPRGRLTVHRVELAEQRITEIKDLQEHTLFVGFNNTFMIHARDFPNLSPNHVYIPDDNTEYIVCDPFDGRELTCLNLEDATLTDLSFPDSQLDWPPPVWFRPHLS
ncbi:hypothetical protein QOZ80_1BG0062040 [Eleusine coracana subsp. coracana]|nr:hypothetical protein QOZ80_1BG0062040 [Eleusine coracana subsp. coracana]